MKAQGQNGRRREARLNRTQRAALKALVDAETATLSRNATGMRDDVLNIHVETALVLIRGGFVEPIEGQKVEATRAGERFISGAPETNAERRRRTAAEAMEAQRSGKWYPAPAGASAAASRESTWDKQERRAAASHLTRCRETVKTAREDLVLLTAWEDLELSDLQVKLLEDRVTEAEQALLTAQKVMAQLKARDERAAA